MLAERAGDGIVDIEVTAVPQARVHCGGLCPVLVASVIASQPVLFDEVTAVATSLLDRSEHEQAEGVRGRGSVEGGLGVVHA